jgi:DNA topoisomerase-2
MSKDSSKYDKLTQREHVLVRPDTYVGSIECTDEEHWIYDEEKNKMLKKNIKFTPGFLKIFDEILVNSADASQNDKTCDTIKVEYNKDEGYISVWNNGENGIPIEEHEKHKMLIPTMIFGELLTGSNFDDTTERTTGGRNGLGSKLVNIFSTRFIIEIVDSKRKKKYIQEWSENMSKIGKPKVTDAKNTKSYIKVTFYPDITRFGLKDMNNDHYNLFYRRTIDIAGMNENKLKVFFNEKKIDLTNFRSYINLYYPDEEVYIDETNERWKVGILYRPDDGNHVISFVNSINTYNGGTHVTHVVDNNILKTLINDYIKKKDKEIKISPQLLKDNLVFFINSTLVNPSFSSQTKDSCTSKVEKFGSKYIMHQPFIKKFAKCGIIDQVIELAKFKENSSLKKTDGKKTTKIRGIPKLDDANKAGSKESIKCSLILTEGDSAKAFAMSGMSVIGRDYFGAFPLKGKLLNTREATPTQLMNNEEINNLKQIIGLKHDIDYSKDENFNQLRYGRIICLTDADVDGSHIKGLLMNFFHSIWPSLVSRSGFITSMATPIVKAFKGKEEKSFYNLTDYDDWIENNNTNLWKIKYYKGLGTSTSAEAKQYFNNFENKLINYIWSKKIESETISNESDNEPDNESDNEPILEKLPYDKSNDEDAILLAFDKNRADDRKVWLQHYNRKDVLKYEEKEITYSKFIHSDLIHFSNDDLTRSIPSLVDGLKPSQRKILYGAFLRGLDKTEVKVAQLAGFVSDKAAYHHGEASLMGAIIGMAQNYMGSNNINILKPNGQFGSRIQSGKDYASPRYIWTELEKISCMIYNPIDDPVLIHQDEDGLPIEPEYYVPIIPMILVNGTQGIGTGFSTKIPPYNPKDIISNLKLKLKGKQMEEMDPWWQSFEGTIAKVDDYNYEIYGSYYIKDNKLIITELPVGEATSDYKAFLEKLLEGDEIKKTPIVASKTIKGKKPPIKKIKEDNPFLSYKENCTDEKIYFELTFEDGFLDSSNNIEKQYHLVKKYSLNNMNLFDKNGTIHKYNNVLCIIDEYYLIRLEYYEKRKAYQLELLEYQLKLISYKVKFILMIIEKTLVINNKKKIDIEDELEKLQFPRLSKNKNDTDLSYNYLLSMPIYNLTKEKIDELKNQEEEKITEYNILEKMTVEKIWLNELEKIEKEYNSWLKQKDNVSKQENKTKTKIKKVAK